MVVENIDDGYLKKLYIKNNLPKYAEIVEATDSWYGSHNSINNLLNWSCPDDFRYFSNQSSQPFITFEFKTNIPKFKMYSFETHLSGMVSHPLSWIVEGSNDNKGNCWDLLDSRDVTILNSYSKKANFTMKESH